MSNLGDSDNGGMTLQEFEIDYNLQEIKCLSKTKLKQFVKQHIKEKLFLYLENLKNRHEKIKCI